MYTSVLGSCLEKSARDDDFFISLPLPFVSNDLDLTKVLEKKGGIILLQAIAHALNR